MLDTPETMVGMRAESAGKEFMRMIEQAQLAPDDLAGHVDVFKRFAAKSIEDVGDRDDPHDDSDVLLFETLIDRGEFHWDLGRQVFADEEPMTMGIEATFDVDDELRRLPPAQVWGGTGEDAGDFFAEIERMPAWRLAFERRPRSLSADTDEE